MMNCTAPGRPSGNTAFPWCSLVLDNSLLHTPPDIDGSVFSHCGSWLKLIFVPVFLPFSWQGHWRGDVCPMVSGRPLFLSSPISGDSVILYIFFYPCAVFSDIFKSCFSPLADNSTYQEHCADSFVQAIYILPLGHWWRIDMDIHKGVALDRYYSLWGAQGQEEGEIVQKGCTYTYEKLVMCPLERQTLQCSLLWVEVFSPNFTRC